MIDLHCHSTASDGSFSPTELGVLAGQAGLRAIALTDHDTLAGIPEFVAGMPAGIEAIAGVEISSSWYGTSMHLLGLFVDIENSALLDLLEELREQRIRRGKRIVERLVKQGCAIDYEEVYAEASGDCLGRPHMARVLVRHGYCTDLRDAFDRFLNDQHVGDIRRWLPLPKDAIAAVHAAGGVASWAHPSGVHNPSRSRLRRTVSKLKEAGIDALEAYYAQYTDEQTQVVCEIADEFGLKRSGGSDFHGENTPGVSLGIGKGKLHVPDELLEQLRSMRQQVAPPDSKVN
ncbi:MAG: putative metal-dependent phosphoesterase TrpH [Rhodothermales bacterium]|jgi:predicted metal-dependent phosphoesterase TrpH